MVDRTHGMRSVTGGFMSSVDMLYIVNAIKEECYSVSCIKNMKMLMQQPNRK